MRLQELSLRIPGDEFRVRFHTQLTVLNGIGVLERRALLDSLVGALAGGPDSTELSYLDASGRTVTVACEGGNVTATYEDGSTATRLLDALGCDSDGLRERMTVRAADLGLQSQARAGEPAELTEARNSLETLTEELQRALAARQAVDAMRSELATLDERIRTTEDDQARRRYARLLADLERVRAEAAALRSGRTGADGDRHLLQGAKAAHDLAERWNETNATVIELAATFGDHDRLDERALAEALALPDQMPAGLAELSARYEKIRDEHQELTTRLREMAASALPEPSDPLVTELARIDQDLLWSTHERLADASARLRTESVALGGTAPEGSQIGAAEADEIERAHGRVVAAETRAERARRPGLVGTIGGVAAGTALVPVMPFVAPAGFLAAAASMVWFRIRPNHALRRAEKHERATLERCGAATYLAFHLRRVEAIHDPDARERLELATLEHRLARDHWQDLVGDVEAERAVALRDEISSYTAALRELGGAAGEIEQLRADIEQRLEPELEQIRGQIRDLCEPFGVDDPALALRLVEHQVAQARVAKLQRRLEEGEASAAASAAELDALLGALGFAEGELSARVGAFEWALSRATEREQSRVNARDLADVEAELTKLETEARSQRRPEWASVTAKEADGPDIGELHERRDATASAYQAAVQMLPDVERLADRHGALERRVAVLEQAAGDGIDLSGSDIGEIREYLLAQLTQASHAGPNGDPLPVVLDEAFMRVPADGKWELLDLLERLTEKVQVVYLTDDPYVGAWARRRSAAGAITLLEPISESA